MASQRISIRVPAALGERLRKHTLTKGQAESEVVRSALETYLARKTGDPTAYDLAEQAGLIGAALRGPKDLSTNPRHFRDFGKSR